MMCNNILNTHTFTFIFFILLGLAQCAELVSQLRGKAEKKQVDGAKVGLQHNFGIGGAAVVTMYKKYNQSYSAKL